MIDPEEEFLRKERENSPLYNRASGNVITHGQGVFVYDDEGRDHLDCSAGTFNLSLGYAHPELIEVATRQMNSLVHLTSSLRAQPVEDLAASLVELASPGIVKAHVKSCGGSTANEGAIKMAQFATGGRDVISLFRSHHGQTIATAGYSGNASRLRIHETSVSGRIVVPDPYCRRCVFGLSYGSCGIRCATIIDDFIEFASSGRVACVIVEPISGNGGNIVPPPEYFGVLASVCRDNDIALICDEIQTGIGRTGHLFASEHFGLEPDAITVGKGLGGMGFPIAAILTNDRLSNLPTDAHSFTYGGNVLAAAVANRVLQIISAPSFLEHVRSVGMRLRRGLEAIADAVPFLEHPTGIGLMLGCEVVHPDDGSPDVELTNRLIVAAPDHGLLLRSSRYGQGNVVKFRPPLVITDDEVDLLLDRLTSVLSAAGRSCR